MPGDRTCPFEGLLAFGTVEAMAEVVRFVRPRNERQANDLVAQFLTKVAAMPVDAVLDFAVLRGMIGTPIPDSLVDDYLSFARRRRPPEAVDDLLGLLSEKAVAAHFYEPAFEVLLSYESPDVWRQTRQEIDRLSKEGRIGRLSYEFASTRLDALLADPREIDAAIQSTWRRLKDALREGDVDSALTGIVASKRTLYARTFQELKDKRVNVDEVFTEIKQVKIDDGRAEYEMIRREDGQAFSYFVLFVRDVDGTWRLKSM